MSLNTCRKDLDLILMNLNKLQHIEMNYMFTFLISLCRFQFFSTTKNVYLANKLKNENNIWLRILHFVQSHKNREELSSIAYYKIKFKELC